MMRSLLILTVFLSLTIGCSTEKDKKIYILFDSVNGLTEGCKVQTRGLNIGQVTNITLFGNDKVLVETTIDRQHNIPQQSTFTLASADVLGKKTINIDYADTEVYYNTKDTVQGLSEKSLQMSIGSSLDSIKTVLMSDSGARVYIKAMNKALGFGDTAQVKKK